MRASRADRMPRQAGTGRGNAARKRPRSSESFRRAELSARRTSTPGGSASLGVTKLGRLRIWSTSAPSPSSSRPRLLLLVSAAGSAPAGSASGLAESSAETGGTTGGTSMVSCAVLLLVHATKMTMLLQRMCLDLSETALCDTSLAAGVMSSSPEVVTWCRLAFGAIMYRL